MKSEHSKRKIAEAVQSFFRLFPQSRKAPAEEIEIAAGYAESLCEWPVDVVYMALRQLAKRDNYLVPSAGEIHRRCEQIIRRGERVSDAPLPPLEPAPVSPKKPFDPTAADFSPFELGMTMEQIISAITAYNRGDDWRSMVDNPMGQR